MVQGIDSMHGGDWRSMRDSSGESYIDFSANINPLGMHPAVRQALLDSVMICDRYPDPLCRDLRNALALREGWSQDAIVCGNGASDLLFRIVQAIHPRNTLVPIPSFSEYESALVSAGCGITWYQTCAEDGFQVTLDILDAITEEVDLLILCDPGNPAGTSIAPQVLEAIADRCRQVGVWCLVDRCFEDFVGSGALLYPLNHRMVVLKAFTKSHALAGVRIGHALFGDSGLAEAVRCCGQSWPVSTCAQMAGAAAAAAGQKLHLVQTRVLVANQRKRLMAALRSLGLLVIESDANFICMQTPMADFSRRLEDWGVYIRDCSNYRGLEPGWYRIAVRSEHQNTRLLDVVGKIFGEDSSWERC